MCQTPHLQANKLNSDLKFIGSTLQARRATSLIEKSDHSLWVHEIGEFEGAPDLETLGNKVDHPKQISDNQDLTITEKKVRKKLKTQFKTIKYKSMTPSTSFYSCGNSILKDGVDLVQNIEHKNYSFHGIATCNNVWACPVCRAKIMKQRAESITDINMKYDIFKTYHAVLTLPHNRGQRLSELIGSNKKKNGMVGAMKRVKQSKFWRNLKTLGYQGDIKVIEVTYSQNAGFHPHYHIVLYFNHELTNDAESIVKYGLFNEWQRQVKKEFDHIPLFSGYHFDKIAPDQVDYISKWGLGAELTATNVKRGKKKDHYSVSELEMLLIKDQDYLKKIKRIDQANQLAEMAEITLREYYHTMHMHRLMAISGNKEFRSLFSQAANDAEMMEAATDDKILSSEIKYTIPKGTYKAIQNSELTEVFILDMVEFCETSNKDFIQYFTKQFPWLEPPKLATIEKKQLFNEAKRAAFERKKHRYTITALMKNQYYALHSDKIKELSI